MSAEHQLKRAQDLVDRLVDDWPEDHRAAFPRGNGIRIALAAYAECEDACFELVGALNVLMGWVKAWDCDFVMDDEWPADEAKIKAAIMRAGEIIVKALPVTSREMDRG